ncbi:imelysin family protein [Hymenobacter rubidus]|uniref:imelysin family protein n=1 Tax=Hymenobacter rubidus TaxID=1441626 RepID=UPI00191D3792|nr:imelysin family protein [Hymenobacter rubidus]
MKKLALALAATLLLAGCQKEEIDPQNTVAGSPGYNAAALLDHAANVVIVGTYREVDQKAAALQTAVVALAAAPTPAALAAARQAYRDARAPWEVTEAFAFGPVSTQGLDAVIDTWPLNRVDLAALLASPDPLTPASLRPRDGGLQGFHPIEFLLFGNAANKALGDFTPREYTFLTSSAQNLKAATGRLLQAWQAGGGNFAATLAKAGPGNPVYPKQKQAVQELLDGLTAPADELANSKMERPLAQQTTDVEEAKFSQNSKAEFLQNLAGIEALYTGRLGTASGAGFSDLVAKRNPALDARFRQELAAAQQAIAGLPGRFDEAIFQNPAAVRAAQAKVRTVLAMLQTDVQPLVDAL